MRHTFCVAKALYLKNLPVDQANSGQNMDFAMFLWRVSSF